MNVKFAAPVSAGMLLAALMLTSPVSAQTTIFNTPDFRQDRALWTAPAYYLNNTPAQLTGQAYNSVPLPGDTGQEAASREYGSPGTGRVGAVNFASPYPYATAWEHYRAWLQEADGGTQHTPTSLPDWNERWIVDGGFGGASPASDFVAYLTPGYQEAYVQDLKATIERRIWSAQAFCLPRGFLPILTAAPMEWIVLPDKVLTIGSTFTEVPVRWIYTDGSGHTPEELAYSRWHGESIGFWDGDALVIHTNQIKGWSGGISEYSDQLESVERYQRVGGTIEGEITLYDPVVYVRPLHTKLTFELDPEADKPELRPLYNSCTDTNGPSPKVHMDANGFHNELLPGDPSYWNSADPRPWATWLDESDRRYRAYLEAGGQLGNNSNIQQGE